MGSQDLVFDRGFPCQMDLEIGNRRREHHLDVHVPVKTLYALERCSGTDASFRDDLVLSKKRLARKTYDRSADSGYQ